jgi:hypothetical protein
MGAGIVTANGANPLEEWLVRMGNLGSTELRDAVRALFAGEVVTTRDGVCEMSALATGGEKHRITIRIPTAPYVADVYLEARDGSHLVGVVPDTRNSIPSPDNWMVDGDNETVSWELFNCVIVSLQTRRNTP